jgi:hypothetical protein
VVGVFDEGGEARYRLRVRGAGCGEVDMTLSSSSSANEAFRFVTGESFCGCGGGGGVLLVVGGEGRLGGGAGLFGVTRRGNVLKGAKALFCCRKASGERESILGQWRGGPEEGRGRAGLVDGDLLFAGDGWQGGTGDSEGRRICWHTQTDGNGTDRREITGNYCKSSSQPA